MPILAKRKEGQYQTERKILNNLQLALERVNAETLGSCPQTIAPKKPQASSSNLGQLEPP